MILDLKNPVAYLCSEFGIDNDLPTYSGGLGILAGDVMNEAALQHFPMVGIGILYKGKDFMQHITGEGKAETRDSEFDHDTSFLRPTTIDGKPILFNLNLESYKVSVKSYHIRLGDKTVSFFLSTDVDGNPPEWVNDMNALYYGDSESQLRQQILLGVGGVKLLNLLNIKPAVFHINEGRPEFIIWEIVKNIMQDEKKTFDKAWKLAKEKIVYTNHTLVTAGNLVYSKSLVEKWASPFAKEMGVETDLLIKDGLTDANTFSTTFFALNISKKHSSVSKVHQKYCKGQWPDYEWIPITNAIHMPRWQDSDFRRDLNDRDLWDQHLIKKRELMSSVTKRTGIGYDPSRLVITWARRLADYKQPRAIFADVKRLKDLLSNPKYPVQLLFAGNSHTGDPNAKSIIEEIIKIFSTDLAKYAIFVPNYNIALANHLTSGSDIWLNTPKGNLEACGTSGMKASANWVLNCTVLDGWTYEVNWEDAGWVLDPENISESFYNILENKIAPLYYEDRVDGIPVEWLKRMRASIELSKDFTTERVLEEYKKLLYS